MENEVVVTKKGQTTIPARLRKKFKIEEGTKLAVVETNEGILFKLKRQQRISQTLVHNLPLLKK